MTDKDQIIRELLEQGIDPTLAVQSTRYLEMKQQQDNELMRRYSMPQQRPQVSPYQMGSFVPAPSPPPPPRRPSPTAMTDLNSRRSPADTWIYPTHPPINRLPLEPRGHVGGDVKQEMYNKMVRDITKPINELIGEFRNFLNATNSQNNVVTNDIRSLIQLQEETQKNISSNQISMTQAQMYAPDAFSNAPGLEYQTDPSAALYREQLSPGLYKYSTKDEGLKSEKGYINVADFYTDQYLSNLKEKEDDIHSSISNQKMGISYAGSTVAGTAIGMGVKKSLATKAGGQVATKALAKVAGTRMGAALLSKLGISTLSGPIGWGLMALDTGLNLMGMPSLTGTITDAGEAVWDATYGQKEDNRRLASDIQKMTPFFVGEGSNILGQGLSGGKAAKLVSGMRELTRDDQILEMSDFANIFKSSADQGLFNTAANEDEMLKRLRIISKNLRLFMRINDDSSYQEAIKTMGELSKLGVSFKDLAPAAKNIQNFTRMAGLSNEQANVFGQQGAMIFGQAGANMGAGYQAGIASRAMSRIATQSGSIPAGLLARYGGEEGASQIFTESIAANLGGPVGQIQMAGLLRINARGEAELDPEKVRKMKSGQMTFEDLQRNAEVIANNPKAQRSYLTNKQVLADQATSQLGLSGGIMSVLTSVEEIMKNSGANKDEALKSFFKNDPDAYNVFRSFTNKDNLRSYVDAEYKQRRRGAFNQQAADIVNRDEANKLTNRVGGFFSDLYYDFVERPMATQAEVDARREQRDLELSMGMSPMSIGSEFMSKADKGFVEGITGGVTADLTPKEMKELSKGMMFPARVTDSKQREIESTYGSKIDSLTNEIYLNTHMDKFGKVDASTIRTMEKEFYKNMGFRDDDGIPDEDKRMAFQTYINKYNEKGEASGVTKKRNFVSKIRASAAEIAGGEVGTFLSRLQSTIREKTNTDVAIDRGTMGMRGFKVIKRDLGFSDEQAAAIGSLSSVSTDVSAELASALGVSSKDKGLIKVSTNIARVASASRMGDITIDDDGTVDSNLFEETKGMLAELKPEDREKLKQKFNITSDIDSDQFLLDLTSKTTKGATKEQLSNIDAFRGMSWDKFVSAAEISRTKQKFESKALEKGKGKFAVSGQEDLLGIREGSAFSAPLKMIERLSSLGQTDGDAVVNTLQLRKQDELLIEMKGVKEGINKLNTTVESSKLLGPKESSFGAIGNFLRNI